MKFLKQWMSDSGAPQQLIDIVPEDATLQSVWYGTESTELLLWLLPRINNTTVEDVMVWGRALARAYVPEDMPEDIPEEIVDIAACTDFFLDPPNIDGVGLEHACAMLASLTASCAYCFATNIELCDAIVCTNIDPVIDGVV